MKLMIVVACLVLVASSSPIPQKSNPIDEMIEKYGKIPSSMGEYVKIPANMGEYVKIPANMGEFVKIPTNMGSSYIPGGMPDFIKNGMEQAGSMPEKVMGGMGGTSGKPGSGGMPDFIKNGMEQYGSMPEKFMGAISGTSGNQNSGATSNSENNQEQNVNIISSRAPKSARTI